MIVSYPRNLQYCLTGGGLDRNADRITVCYHELRLLEYFVGRNAR